MIDRLTAMRQRGESYSDVILRLIEIRLGADESDEAVNYRWDNERGNIYLEKKNG